MPNWNELGMGAAANVANTAIGAGMGLLLEKHNDKRQINQQAKLQAMQIAGQKELTDYNTGKQMEMWKNTSYPAQMEMLKQAGLNPGLIYGMGGGGGQSTNIAQGSLAGADAPKGGQEAMGMGMMMAQLQLVQAQKENIQADTANKQAENPNIPVTGENIKADTALKGSQKENLDTQQGILAVERAVKEATQNMEIAKLMYGTESSLKELEILRNNKNISDATVQTQIKQAKADLAGTLIRNTLMNAERIKTERSTLAKGQQQRLTEEQIKAIWSGVQQGWDNMSISRIKQIMEQQGLDYETEVPNSVKEILDRIYILPKLNK